MSTKYPNLLLAYELMLKDQGLEIPQGLKVPSATILCVSEHQLFLVDRFLFTLTNDELTTLCCGDQKEWGPLLAKAEGWNGLKSQTVHEVLDNIFFTCVLGG